MTDQAARPEPDTTENLAWQSTQDAEAQRYLQSLPAYQPLRQALRNRMVDNDTFPLQRAGGRWFQPTTVGAAADQPVFVVRDTPKGEPRVLVDPNKLTAQRGHRVSLIWASPSPDGKTLAYAVSTAGTETAEVTLLDVATGEPRPDLVPWNILFAPAWLPDSSGFYCSARDISSGAHRMPVYRFDLGQPAPTVAEPVPAVDPFMFPAVSQDGRYVAIHSGNSEPRTEYVRQPDGSWTPLLADVPGVHIGTFLDDDYIAIMSDPTTPRGRVVRIPVRTATDPASWMELVPESADVPVTVAVVDKQIVLGYLRDASARLRVVDPHSGQSTEVELPGPCVVSSGPFGAAISLVPMFTSGEGEISFVHSTPTTSFATYRYVISTGELELLVPPQVELWGTTSRRISVRSSDGTDVPALLVHRADLDLSRPHPTIINGYGGFNVSLLPSYTASFVPLIEAGAIFVLAHLRGGGEFGADWWRSGRRDRKQQTFDDLYAIAEHLINTGVTTAEQLAVEGASNGGLLAGAAAVQRPDLWAAVVSRVPILDLLGFGQDPVSFAIAREEYGDPAVPEEAAWLRAVSPVHNVKDETPYCATLFVAGENDPRCPPWHARSLTRLMRQATTSDAPILLRVHNGQGHGSEGRDATIDENAEWLAFIADRIGLKLG